MNLSETSRIVSTRKIQRSGLPAAVLSSCVALCLSLSSAADASTDVEQPNAHQQVSGEEADPYAEFLGKYIDWASSIETEGQQRGTPLTSEQIELAREVGINRPQDVRLIFVDTVPFPTDDEAMRKVGEDLGFIGPDVINNAQAFGYTIWVRNGFTLDRPSLAHELVHVAQIERSANFGAYVKQYMMELLEHGHTEMPLEIEAYKANQRYQCDTTSTPSLSSERSANRSPDTVGSDAASYREDARGIVPLINRAYAYLDRFGAAGVPSSHKLQLEAEEVTDRRSLLRYAERALLALSDHHAITGSSLVDSWAVVPSFADLWVVENNGVYTIDAVRSGSPAREAGIRQGERIISVDGVPIEEAVSAFWTDLGLPVTSARAAFAARVLTAGRRDRPRRIGVHGVGAVRILELPSLYSTPRIATSPVTVTHEGGKVILRINDALGENETIEAFDAAMVDVPVGQLVEIDLRNTPSGGNTAVARAILGWFVERPQAYQMHNLPAEQRDTGIARQWVEQVLPRTGKYHPGPVRVLVGRWTGSMGEGLAIGFDAIGAEVMGQEMAGLRGAIYDHRLEQSRLIIKLPTERLMHVDGTPREEFVPDAFGQQ